MNTPSSSLQDRFSLSETDGDPGERVYEYRVDGTRIGYGSVFVDPRRKRILWHQFYPRDIESTTRAVPPGVLGKTGVATLAHIETLRDLRALLGDDYRVGHKIPVSPSRMDHLRAMGIAKARSKGIPLPSYLLASMRYGAEKGFTYDPEEMRVLEEAARRIDGERKGFWELLATLFRR